MNAEGALVAEETRARRAMPKPLLETAEKPDSRRPAVQAGQTQDEKPKWVSRLRFWFYAALALFLLLSFLTMVPCL